MSNEEHRSRTFSSVSCVVLTISDTRTPASDPSGALIRELLESSGHVVFGYEVLPDEPDIVRERISHYVQEPSCQAVLLTGGTGLAPRDNTYEAVSALLDKRLDGFGELFRLLGYQRIGAAAMLSRAVGGVCGDTIVFSMPGSTDAVRLAMEELILPELGHVTALVSHDGNSSGRPPGSGGPPAG